MDKPDPKVIDEVKKQFPDRKVVPLKHTIDCGTSDPETIYAVALVPNRGEWSLLRRSIADEDKRAFAVEQMVRNCVKWPESAALDALLERLPGIASTFGNTLSKLAGSSAEAEVGNW